MSLTTPTTLILAAGAAGLAWTLPGTAGVGVLAGFLAGASVAGAVLFVQKRIARSKPAYVIHAVLGGFLVKAAVLMATTLAVRFVPALEECCDPRAYLFAFAATAVAILLPSTIDTLRVVEAKPAVPNTEASQGLAR